MRLIPTTTTLGTSHEEGSRITNQDGRIGDQRLPAPNASALTPGHGDDNTSERS